MLKAFEIGLTIISISIGLVEILGRTNVIAGPTPIERVQSAFNNNLPPVTPTPGALPDLTVEVAGCDVTLQGLAFDVGIRNLEAAPVNDSVEISVTSAGFSGSGSTVVTNDFQSTFLFVDTGGVTGVHDAIVEIDPGGLIAETDDGNNATHVTLTIPDDPLSAGPDFNACLPA